jgi:dolichol-phosphate mannosyltransferase
MPQSIVVTMPAYNEEEGIAGFLAEIAQSLSSPDRTVQFVVVDDHSTDGTVAALRATTLPAGEALTVVPRAVNRGHGPTALAAYRAALDLQPDLILHVDGDGQVLGPDFVRVVQAAIEANADVVHGVRTGRTDPWFRKALSRLTRMLVQAAAGRRITDVNTPLRAYHPEIIADLLAAIPTDALVPHVHFSILEGRRKLRVTEVPVTSIERRGSVASGTMWGPMRQTPKLPPKRLVSFAWRAFWEVIRVDLLGRSHTVQETA